MVMAVTEAIERPVGEHAARQGERGMGVLQAFDLTGKVAVITGGNMGLGEVFSHALAEAGATVVVAARTVERSKSVAGQIAEAGGKALAVALDVTKPESCAAMVGEVTALAGPIDILVNNAGICYHRPALEVTLQEWQEVMDVNVNGVWHCAQAVGRQMVERGRGVIVNIGSMSGLVVNRPQMQPAYNASKAAVHHLTRSLAAEWAPFNVRVNAIAPGYMKTLMSPVDDPQYRRHWIEDAPMLRYGMPEELGPTVVYLASDASSFVTGSVLVVDGGYSLW
jgi:NAD(P)-dependent dehydrogenase (short-subunit alcohol dehydrogenase family)